MDINKDAIKNCILDKLNYHFGVQAEDATPDQCYRACVMIINEILITRQRKFMTDIRKAEAKTVSYLCMEFLLGRSLKSSLYNLGLLDPFDAVINELGYTLEEIFDMEPDAGLGNGGLGRLAACFMESAATLGYSMTGYSILYEYGIFKQQLLNGWQIELPDPWLPGGEIWLNPRPDEACTVKFGGHVNEEWNDYCLQIDYKDFTPVLAIPYDIIISGYQKDRVSLLRLWKATSSEFDLQLFHQGDYLKADEKRTQAEMICKILYPPDHHHEGKRLRLKQQYFLVSASIQDIVRKHLVQYKTLKNFSDKNAIHINETHPALAIPELMRIFLDEYCYDWDEAWNIITNTFSFTNHTIMREALEVWPEELLANLLPRIYHIIKEIQKRYQEALCNKYHFTDEQLKALAIIHNGQIHMANMCLHACHTINGVSKIHSSILQKNVFRNYSALHPEKFCNITNGFNYRRWLCQANPKMCQFISECIGDGFHTDPMQLQRMVMLQDDLAVLNKIAEIKRENKIRLADYIYSATKIKVDINSIFDVQVKRLHEYKRQLLNVMHILYLYDHYLQHSSEELPPRTFLFAAKAAPSYSMAKRIIHLICCLADEINSNPSVNDKLKIIYLEDYRVTLAELLMPAAEISEQISLAGTEASGTGNMKLMINGAITVGTLDGANIEIKEAVGEDNILLFGLRNEEVQLLRKVGYFPSIYLSNPAVRNIIERLNSNIHGESFHDIASYLIGSSDGIADPYMVLADFDSYCHIQKEAARRYSDPILWNKMSLRNIASAGRFAADRAIKEYAEKIWHIKTV
jgi:starch phosphorylase